MNEDLAKRVEDLERRVTALENPSTPVPHPSTGQKPLSIGEFVKSKAPQTTTETAMVIVYSLEKHSGISPFNQEDLVKGFALAREPIPGNPSDVLAKLARRKFVMETPDKKGGQKGWTMTNTGEAFVDNGLKESGAP